MTRGKIPDHEGAKRTLEFVQLNQTMLREAWEELDEIKRVLSNHWYRVEHDFDHHVALSYSCRLCDATAYTVQHPDASIADMLKAIKHYKWCIIPKVLGRRKAR